MDGGDIPHVKAGASDPLQKCLSQFRGDIIHGVQLLGGVVIADKQPNLVGKDGKMGEVSVEGQVVQWGSILVARAVPISGIWLCYQFSNYFTSFIIIFYCSVYILIVLWYTKIFI